MLDDIDIDIEIKKIFFQVFPGLTESNFDWKKKQNDYQDWDSFSQLNLITLIETKFHISISYDELVNIQSAEDALNLVKRSK